MATTEKDIIKEYPKAKDIADLIVGLGNKLRVDPMYLARTMSAETGGTFSPSRKNTAGSGATGLIQFTKETAKNLGTTTQALSKMSAREQMSFVERYFSSIGAGNLARLRNGSQHDVNMAIFYPRAIGKGFNFNIAEDIRRTQSRGAANRFKKQNKGIVKAGDYTMKLTPPLPRLKPSENKKALKIIEKSQEKELTPEEENFIKDVEKQDSKSFMDLLKEFFGFKDAQGATREDFNTARDKAREDFNTARDKAREDYANLRTNKDAEMARQMEEAFVENQVDEIETSPEEKGEISKRTDIVGISPTSKGLLERKEQIKKEARRKERSPLVTSFNTTVRNDPNREKLSKNFSPTIQNALYRIELDPVKPLTEDEIVSLETANIPSSRRIKEDPVFAPGSDPNVPTDRKLPLIEGDPLTEEVRSTAGLSRDLSRNWEPQERSQMKELFGDEIKADEELFGDDGDTPNYAIVDSENLPYVDDEFGDDKTFRAFDPDDRSRFERNFDIGFDDPTPMGEADPKEDVAEAGIDPNDPIDFSFLKSLFTGGFGFGGRDSELEENIGADYFYDEPMPMGGEVDLRDESDDVIMNFEEGGEVKADFDGKEDVDEDEGDPPPLAKPEEVADDIPALLSEGEYVIPANVVRYLGVERIVDMHRQALAEIQQMEDLGMIQNVDENGEPEQDDTEMKFAEGEEPEEGVTKGTIIIASSKPKGMMCPEPIMMKNGGDPGGAPGDPGEPQGGTGPGPGGTAPGPGGAPGDPNEPQGPVGIGSRDRDKDKSEEVGFSKNPNEDRAKEEAGLTGLQGFMQDLQTGILSGIPGITNPQSNIDREKAEAEASQPGDMDFELEINEDNIKQDKVNDVVADLITKNVYIEGVGYVPLAGLMSPKDSLPV